MEAILRRLRCVVNGEDILLHVSIIDFLVLCLTFLFFFLRFLLANPFQLERGACVLCPFIYVACKWTKSNVNYVCRNCAQVFDWAALKF